MDTPLSSFKALVKFQFDRVGLTTEIAAVRKQLQGLTGLQERSAKRKTSETRKQESEERKAAKLLEKIERDRTAAWLKDQRTRARWAREQLRLNERTSNPSAHVEAHRKAQAAQSKIDDKINRDRTAAALKAQRVADRWKSADDRAQERAARKRHREMVAEAHFMNREFNLRRAREVLLHNEALRMNREFDRQRAASRLREHTEALRMNRQFDLQRRQQNRPPSGGGSGGSNPNPWHIGGMAGGLGGLITRGNLAAVGAGAFTQQSFTQANFDIAQAPQFEFITGSAEEAAKQVAFLNKEVDRLSLPLRETSNMYRQLLASTKKGLGIEKTQELFSSFSNISTMLGLSEDAQARGLRAFSQMASKGQVMS